LYTKRRLKLWLVYDAGQPAVGVYFQRAYFVGDKFGQFRQRPQLVFFRSVAAGIHCSGESPPPGLCLACRTRPGQFDFLLKIAIRDMQEYNGFLMDKLATLPNIGSVQTYFVLSEGKFETAYPLKLS